MILRAMKVSDLFVYPSLYSLVVHNLVIAFIIIGALIILLLFILYLVISAAIEHGVTKALKKHSNNIGNNK